jgi:hypothetical protein
MEMLEVSESGSGQQPFPSAMLLLPRPNLSHYNRGKGAVFIPFANSPQTETYFTLQRNIFRPKIIE